VLYIYAFSVVCLFIDIKILDNYREKDDVNNVSEELICWIYPLGLGAHNFCVATLTVSASVVLILVTVPSCKRLGSVNLIPFF